MDAALRNALWNVLAIFFWEEKVDRSHYLTYPNNRWIRKVLRRLWMDYFNIPMDTLSNDPNEVYMGLRDVFLESFKWYEVYDFIEFLASTHDAQEDEWIHLFTRACNNIMESRRSGYRFVGKQIVPITSPVELDEIERARSVPSPNSVQVHLTQAIKHFSNRINPDYRNSIKESISAVEALCKVVAGNPKAVLNDALKQIEMQRKAPIHPALRAAFDKLYAYTNDGDGIRHALKLDESPDLKQEDAQFMLIACSAFINYVLAKTA